MNLLRGRATRSPGLGPDSKLSQKLAEGLAVLQVTGDFYKRLFRLFHSKHTALHTARMNGAKYQEYHPLLLEANNETRLFGLMKAEWFDCPAQSELGDPVI